MPTICYFEKKLQSLEKVMIGITLAAEQCVKSSLSEENKKIIFAGLQNHIVNCVEEMEILTSMIRAAEKNRFLNQEVYAVATYRWAVRLERGEQ